MTGKSEFFRRILPEEMKEFFVEESLPFVSTYLDKAIIFHDGMFEHSIESMKTFLTIKTHIKKLPYQREAKRITKTASLVSASNQKMKLPKSKFTCLELTAPIDFAKFNSIDKADLWREAYVLCLKRYQ